MKNKRYKYFMCVCDEYCLRNYLDSSSRATILEHIFRTKNYKKWEVAQSTPHGDKWIPEKGDPRKDENLELVPVIY